MLRYRRLRAAAGLLFVLSTMFFALLASPRAAVAQSVLTMPDFSGMYRPDDSNSNVIAHDPARGWIYLVLANGVNHNSAYFINGVRASPLVRVNEAGVVDTTWIADESIVPSRAQVLGNGELLIYDTAWRRLVRGDDNVLRAQALAQPFEPGSLPLAQPSARDAAGNVYFAYSRAASPAVVALRRFMASGEPDINWRLEVDLAFGTLSHFTVATDGSIYYLSTNVQPPFSVGEPGASTLVRIAGSDGARWTRPLSGKVFALASDDLHRVYLLGHALDLQSKPGTLLRVDAAGVVDPGWGLPSTNTSVPLAGAICIRDGAAITGLVQRSGALMDVALTRVALASSSNPMTAVIGDTARTAPLCTGGRLMLRAALRITVASPGPATLALSNIFAVAGVPPVIASIQRWNDHYVVGGEFEYWFEGVRYANLMRLNYDLRPDSTWRPEVSGAVRALGIDATGGLVIGGDKLGGAQTHLLRFAADGQRDPRWNHALDGAVHALAIAGNGELYAGGQFSNVNGAARPALARFLADGHLDTNWMPQLAAYRPTTGASSRFAINSIIVANDDDLLVSWEAFWNMTGGDGLFRLGRRDGGLTHPLPDTLQRTQVGSLVRDNVTGTLFGLRQRDVTPFGTQLVQIDNNSLEPFALWTPYATTAMAVAFDGQHVYLQDGTRLWRGGAPDGRWTPQSTPHAGRVPLPTTGEALVWPPAAAPFAVRTPAATIGTRTVVEYFARDANRFFMTARVNEQAQLDAMPATFVRTGMQLQAFDGSLVAAANGVVEGHHPPQAVAAVGSLPTCRYFAPRDRGGSGTHFYGLRGDCQLLNTLTGFINEGYDFALHPPKAGICPAASPVAVFRLFNNRAAQNDSNHRYVVSTVRRDEMLARGWLSEGVAFCANSATDSHAFGNW